MSNDMVAAQEMEKINPFGRSLAALAEKIGELQAYSESQMDTQARIRALNWNDSWNAFIERTRREWNIISPKNWVISKDKAPNIFFAGIVGAGAVGGAVGLAADLALHGNNSLIGNFFHGNTPDTTTHYSTQQQTGSHGEMPNDLLKFPTVATPDIISTPTVTPNGETLIGAIFRQSGGGSESGIDLVYDQTRVILPSDIPNEIKSKYSFVANGEREVGQWATAKDGTKIFISGQPPSIDGLAYDGSSSRPELGVYAFSKDDKTNVYMRALVEAHPGSGYFFGIDKATGKPVLIEKNKNGNFIVQEDSDPTLQGTQDWLLAGPKQATISAQTGRGGFITIGDITLSTLSPEAPAAIILAHPQTWAECLLICPKINNFKDVNKIKFQTLIPIESSSYSSYFSRGGNVETLTIIPDDSHYLGSVAIEWSGVTGILSAFNILLDSQSEIVYIAKFIDDFNTEERVNRYITSLESGSYQVDGVLDFIDRNKVVDQSGLAMLNLIDSQNLNQFVGGVNEAGLGGKVLPAGN